MRRRTRGRAGFVIAAGCMAVGAGILIAAALLLRPAAPEPEGEQTVPFVEIDQEQESDAHSSDVPRGIVLRTDPSWVARVSAATGIPTRALSAYAGADIAVREESGCAVGWNTLAAIGLVESAHGAIQGGRIAADGVARPEIIGIALDGTRSAVVADTDDGAVDGDASWDRAVGPLQFIPDTWQRWGSDGDDDGVADVHDIDDAALTAARYLCEAHGTLDGQDAWIGAIRSYNDNPDYQDQVAAAAGDYASFG